MYAQEDIKPYSDSSDKKKGEQVEKMFDNIAPTYDQLNHRLSWDIDKWWRKKAIRQLTSLHPQSILDVATGTGDLAILSAQMLHPKSIVGIDISEKMMEIGRQKIHNLGLDDTITLIKDDCMNISFEDESFDAVTAAFGIRNFSDLDKGLREMHRILRKGGQLSIIELTTPVTFPMKQLFWLYSHALLPLYGRMISRDKEAYSYLTRTIEAFPQGEKMKEILTKAGFSTVSFQRLTCGICTLYSAKK